MKDWLKIAIGPELTVLEAMRALDHAGSGFLVILDERGVLLGALTDGDIRRGLLHDVSLKASVDLVMNKRPLTLPEGTGHAEAIAFLRSHVVTHVPLVDASGVVKSVVSLNDTSIVMKMPNTVVMMVGGLGSRLGELTSNCPKPMLKVAGRPVLELIVENLREQGFSDFIFCVNYRAEMIEAHFGDGKALGVRIRYVQEDKRMGTAGALALLPADLHGPLLVMNGDIVTKVNFTSLFDFHKKQSPSATMAVRRFDYQVPYGVVRTDGRVILGIEEKPIQTFLVSAGIYVVETSCLKHLPANEFFDMPHLFESLMKTGEVAQAFPIHEYWIDIGRQDDLIRAEYEYGPRKED